MINSACSRAESNTTSYADIFEITTSIQDVASNVYTAISTVYTMILTSSVANHATPAQPAPSQNAIPKSTKTPRQPSFSNTQNAPTLSNSS